MLDITRNADSLWFLRFIASVDELTKLSRLRLSTLNNIPSVGHKYAAIIKACNPMHCLVMKWNGWTK